jgi:tetratricopeptide (TPR) repeat protein
MLGIYHALRPRDAFPKAKVAARRALELDEDLAEAHATLGFSSLYFDWDLAASETALREAIRLSPGYPSAHQWYGMCLFAGGRHDEAVAEARRAQELDPFSPSINTTAVWPLLYAPPDSRHLPEALERLRTAVDLHPQYWMAHYYLGLAYGVSGDFPRAVPAFEQARALSDSSWALDGLGYALGRTGRRAEAAGTLARLQELSSRLYVSPYSQAAIHAGMEEPDRAIASLESAIEDRSWRMVWLAGDPFFDTLRGRDAFERVVSVVQQGNAAI